MKKFIIFILFIFLSFNISVAFCQQNSIDVETLKKLDSETAAKVLNQLKNNEKETTIDKLKDIKEISSIGKEIGIAFKDICQTLNVEINNFLCSPVGIIATFLILWKLIGGQILGISILLILLILTYKSTSRFFLSDKQIDEKGKISYIKRYEFEDDQNAISCAIFHGLVFICIIIGFIVIIIKG